MTTPTQGRRPRLRPCRKTAARTGLVPGASAERLATLRAQLQRLQREVARLRLDGETLDLYGRALECTSNGVVIADMRLPGRPIHYVNAAYCRITGYAPREVIGRPVGFLRNGDDDQAQRAHLRRAIAQGRSATAVLRNYRKDGTLFFNELALAPVRADDGGLRYYVGIVNDVTEREQARMALAERTDRLDAVFDLSPDGFVVFDPRGNLVYSNPSFHHMTGLDFNATAAVVTMQDFDARFAALCDPAQPCRPIRALMRRRAGESGHGVDTVELRCPERRVLARVVRHHQQGHDETILYLRDITRETEIDRLKSEFLTTAAHELRTPMVSVFGFTELLLQRNVTEERRRDMLQTVHRQASLLINMVNELLDLARIEARQGKDIKRQACRLADLIEQAVRPLEGANGIHRFEVHAPQGACDLWVDPEKTHQALTNVLSNAVKYSPRGGVVRVSSVQGSLRGGPAIGIAITDPGIGMTAPQLARVFERFYRADPSGNIPGTGLGMSLVKEIVELQGGRVDLASQPGQGTTVTLWLPCRAPRDEPQTRTAPCMSDT